MQIPGGHVDYFLVSAKDKKVKDFIGIELQTMDTTGTVWPERQRFLDEQGIEVNEEDLKNKNEIKKEDDIVIAGGGRIIKEDGFEFNKIIDFFYMPW